MNRISSRIMIIMRKYIIKQFIFLSLMLCTQCSISLCAQTNIKDSLELERMSQEIMECMQTLNNRIDFRSDEYLKKTKNTAKKLTLLVSQYEKLTNDSTVKAFSFLGEALLSMVYNARKNIDSAYVHAQSALSLYHPYGKYLCEADSSKGFYRIVFGYDGLLVITREMCVKQGDINKALYYNHIIADSCSFYQFDLERVQSYIRQGQLYEQINDYDNAINSHIKALDLRLKHPDPTDYPLSSQVYNDLLNVIARLNSKQKLLIDNEVLRQKFSDISSSSYLGEFFRTHPLDFCEKEEKEGQTFWICILFNTYIRLLVDFKQYDTLFSIEEGLDDFYTRNYGRESLEYAEYLIQYKNVYTNYYSGELHSGFMNERYKNVAAGKEARAVEIWKKYFEHNPIGEIALKYKECQDKSYGDNIRLRLHYILTSYISYMISTYGSSIKFGNYDIANDAINNVIYVKENILKNFDNADNYQSLGLISLIKGDFLNAEKNYSRSFLLAYERQDTILMAEANLDLYRTYMLLNNYSKAKQRLSDAYELIIKYSYHSMQKSDILKEMADKYKRIYDFETAYNLILLSINEKLDCGQNMSDEDYINWAEFKSTYMPLDMDSILLTHIIEIAARETYTHNVLKASKLLGPYYVLQFNDYEKGAQYYGKAAEVAHELKDSVSEALCLAEIGTIHFARRRYEDALMYMQKAETINSNLRYRELLSLMAYIHNDSIVKVRLPFLFDETTSQLKKEMLSINTIGRERMVKLMPYDVLKSMAYYYPNLSICADIAYNATLLYKGLLQNTQKNISEFIANSNDKVLIELFSRLQLIKDGFNLKPEGTYDETIKSEMESAELEMSILDRLPKNKLMMDLEITWEKVSRKLDKNDVAIEFVEINKLEPLDRSAFCYGALILRKGYHHPIFVKLGTRELIEKNVNAMLHSFNNGAGLTTARWKVISKQLYKAIWEELEEYIEQGDNVYFSAAGMLHQIPIEILSGEDGIAANEKYTIYRLSSTRELCKKTKQEFTSIVLYGGLIYDGDDSHEDGDNPYGVFYAPTDTLSRAGWSYLPSTAKEVEDIALLMDSIKIPAIIREGKEGTEESFREISGTNMSILHIATHGFYFQDKEYRMLNYFEDNGNAHFVSPMQRTGLMMSGGQSAWLGTSSKRQDKDGILLAEEIASLDLSQTGLVVLSACQTGLGDIDDEGEGVYGIQRAFKLAGVKTLLMTLGKVDDAATQLFMKSFYNSLTSGLSTYESFRKAQNYVRNYEYEYNGYKMNYSNPKYWAPFILLDAIDN